MSDGPPVEVIGQGREPAGPRTPTGESRFGWIGRLVRPRTAGGRAVGYVLVAALAAGTIWLAARPQGPALTASGGAAPADSRRVTATASPAGPLVNPAPGQTNDRPTFRDLTVSTLDGDRSFIAFGGHVLLFLHVTNTGPTAAALIDGQVPQDGAFPDAGPGGLTAGTTQNVQLRPRVATEIFLRTRVDCDRVLVGQAVDHLDLTTKVGTASARRQVIDLDGLGAYWDEARRAACSRPDPTSAVSATVMDARGTRAGAGAAPTVDAVASLHNAAGFDAIVTFGPDPTAGLSFLAPALTSAGVAVDGGSTHLTPVRWVVTDCQAAEREQPPSLVLDVIVDGKQASVDAAPDPSFAREWRTALLKACS
jgi:hypothetical protein